MEQTEPFFHYIVNEWIQDPPPTPNQSTPAVFSSSKMRMEGGGGCIINGPVKSFFSNTHTFPCASIQSAALPIVLSESCAISGGEEGHGVLAFPSSTLFFLCPRCKGTGMRGEGTRLHGRLTACEDVQAPEISAFVKGALHLHSGLSGRSPLGPPLKS